MVLKYTNKTYFILLDGFARVCTLSANFSDNPRILFKFLVSWRVHFKYIDRGYWSINKSIERDIFKDEWIEKLELRLCPALRETFRTIDIFKRVFLQNLLQV